MAADPGSMTTTALDDAFATLTAAVQAEREAATLLVDHLTRVRLLLENGDAEPLPDGLAELELGAAGLDAACRRREQARQDLCGVLGIEDGRCTLARLAARAPAPWAQQLAEHRSALRELAERIEREAAADRRRAERDLDAVHRRLTQAGSGGPASAGERRLVADLDLTTLVTELRVREVTYEAIIAVTNELGSRLESRLGAQGLAVFAGRATRST